jgi:hypothetical protein
MAAVTTLDGIQASIRQHAEGAGSSVSGIGQRRGVGVRPGQSRRTRAGVDDLFGALQGAQGDTLELRVLRGADERTVQVVFTPEIEDK